MSRKMNGLALAIGAAMFAASGASAQTYNWNFTLDGPSEPTPSPATGFATITWNTSTQQMSYNVTFSGLLGTTTASHVHASTTSPGTGTAGVATMTPSFAGFPLGVTSGSWSNTFDMNLASSWNSSFISSSGGIPQAQAALLNAMLTNRAYLNIHTQAFPGGEIRGFIPTPGAAAVLGLGVLAAGRRRR